MSKSANFLLIEDDMTDIKIINYVFKKANINNCLCVVKTGEEALNYLKRGEPYDDENQYPPPDIILLDIKLPGMDGFDTAGRIRNMKKYRDIPIFVLTNSVRGEDVNKSFESGANDYIPKPLTIESLVSSLSKINYSLSILTGSGAKG